MARLPQNSLSLDRLFANDDLMIDPSVPDGTHQIPRQSGRQPGILPTGPNDGPSGGGRPTSFGGPDSVPTTERVTPATDAGAHASGFMPNPMDEQGYHHAIDHAIRAAENFVDMQLSPDRDMASRYYRGMPFGDEEDGKSQVVMTEVRDTVLALMPGLLRVFCGSQDPVEFVASGATDADMAQQCTDYINHIFMVDNPGFMILHNAMKDALVRKTGIVTWWFEERETVSEVEFSDLPLDALILLHQESTNQSDNSKYLKYDVHVTKQAHDVDENGQPVVFFTGIVKKRQLRKRFRVRALPPEEFIITPATSNELNDFALVGHRTITTVSQLVQDGYDINLINEALGASATNGAVASLETNVERINRDTYTFQRIFDAGFGATDPASRHLKVVTAYCLIDKDGDGIAEKRKIVTIGDHNKPIYDEMCGDEMTPYAILCPDPEPHTPIGYSLADQTKDLQEIKSQLIRRTLDSLDQSINQRMAVVEGQVNLDDVMNLENGAIIRMKSQGAVQQLTTVFQGQQAMPMIAYIDEVKARRTGITMGPTGLPADILQSTVRSAVDATVDASQDRSEMVARIFAETGIARIFRGLLQLVCTHQDYKRTLRLRGSVVTLDPRSWDADLDIQVNVGTGRGRKQEKLQSLTAILAQQKEIIVQYGPANPLVGLDNVSYTMSQIIKEMGYADPSKFMNPISKQQAIKIAIQAASQPKKMTTEELDTQAQMAKTQVDRQNAIDKNETDKMRILLEDSRQREKATMEHSVAAATAVAEFGAQVNETDLANQQAIDDHVDAMAKEALARNEMMQNADMAGQQMQHEKDMQQTEIDNQPPQGPLAQ